MSGTARTALRLAMGLVIPGLALLSAWTGAAEAWLTGLLVACLHGFGVPALRLAPTVFLAGSQGYEVDFWCTPATLIVCLLFLLWFADQPPLRYLAAALGFALLATVLMTANILLSVHLHGGGPGIAWSRAHYPGLIAAYAVCLGACLLYVRRASSAQQVSGLPQVTGHQSAPVAELPSGQAKAT